MPRQPPHGDPRHYEDDIARLKAKIDELRKELRYAWREADKYRKERDAANDQVIRLTEELRP